MKGDKSQSGECTQLDNQAQHNTLAPILHRTSNTTLRATNKYTNKYTIPTTINYTDNIITHYK